MLRVMNNWQNNQWKCLKSSKIYDYHGGWSTIVIESGKHKMGWMADFPPLSASSVFYL